MNRSTSNLTTAVLATLIALGAAGQAVADDEVCWRRTEGRGVGTIPRNCDLVDEEKRALTCYEKCKPGYSAIVAQCRRDCPAGFTEGALNFCRKPKPYQAARYPWKAGDGIGKKKLVKATQRCEAKHGRGKCEQRQAAIYERCRKGYKKVGIDKCTVPCPSGWKEAGERCERPKYTRKVAGRTQCEPGKTYRAGLCRSECPANFNGVGPVCWQECPASHPHRCGMACATSKAECGLAITDQVMSVLEVAFNIGAAIVTGGGSAAATSGAKGAAAAGKLARTNATRQLMKGGSKISRADAIKKLPPVARKAEARGLRDAANKIGKELKGLSKADIRKALKKQFKDPESLQAAVDAAYALAEGQVEEDSRGEQALAVFASVDPTGVLGVIEAYKKPLCDLQ